MLLAAGADPTLATTVGVSPIAIATERGHVDIVRSLLEYDSRIRVSLRLICDAAERGYTALLRLFLFDDVVDASNRQLLSHDLLDRKSPIALAAAGGHFECVRLLLVALARERRTALPLPVLEIAAICCAAQNDHPRVMRLLFAAATEAAIGAPAARQALDGALANAVRLMHNDAVLIFLAMRQDRTVSNSLKSSFERCVPTLLPLLSCECRVVASAGVCPAAKSAAHVRLEMHRADIAQLSRSWGTASAIRTQIALDDLTFVDDNASSSHGERVAVWRGAAVAVRVVVTADDFESADAIMQAVERVRALPTHHNILHVHGWALTESGAIAMVSEQCDGGPLDGALYGANAGEFDWSHGALVRVAVQVARGLEHVHANALVHRDVAARNVLLWRVDDVIVAKLTGFDLSRDMTAGRVQRATVALRNGTWPAPELSAAVPFFSDAADVYSFGVLLYELFARRVPTAPAVDVPVDASSDLAALMRECRRHEHTQRPSIAAVRSRLQTLLPQRAASDVANATTSHIEVVKHWFADTWRRAPMELWDVEVLDSSPRVDMFEPTTSRRLVLHYTKPQLIRTIATEGVDSSHCRSGWFGNGHYFSPLAEYAMNGYAFSTQNVRCGPFIWLRWAVRYREDEFREAFLLRASDKSGKKFVEIGHYVVVEGKVTSSGALLRWTPQYGVRLRAGRCTASSLAFVGTGASSFSLYLALSPEVRGAADGGLVVSLEFYEALVCEIFYNGAIAVKRAEASDTLCDGVHGGVPHQAHTTRPELVVALCARDDQATRFRELAALASHRTALVSAVRGALHALEVDVDESSLIVEQRAVGDVHMRVYACDGAVQAPRPGETIEIGDQFTWQGIAVQALCVAIRTEAEIVICKSRDGRDEAADRRVVPRYILQFSKRSAIAAAVKE